jgi:hypothetical protein
LIPDYDRESNIDPTARHKDAETISSLFGDLVVSFRWRPLIAGRVVDDLRRWIDILQSRAQGRNYNSSDYPPDVLLLGMASWDMLQQEGDDHLWYEKGLQDLVPLFQELLTPSPGIGFPSDDGVDTRKIIWLNQYTTFDFFAGNDAANRVIFKEKLQLCNRIARRILR